MRLLPRSRRGTWLLAGAVWCAACAGLWHYLPVPTSTPIDQEHFDKIGVGMSHEQVEAIIGVPPGVYDREYQGVKPVEVIPCCLRKCAFGPVHGPTSPFGYDHRRQSGVEGVEPVVLLSHVIADWSPPWRAARARVASAWLRTRRLRAARCVCFHAPAAEPGCSPERCGARRVLVSRLIRRGPVFETSFRSNRRVVWRSGFAGVRRRTDLGSEGNDQLEWPPGQGKL